jgi:hypothetical protein
MRPVHGSEAEVHPQARSTARVRRDSWRYLAFTNIRELKGELGLDQHRNGTGSGSQLSEHQARHRFNGRKFLQDAESALRERSSPRKWWNGELQEATFVSVHHAAAEAVYVLDDARIHARLPMMVQFGEQQLGANDDRVVAVRHLAAGRRRTLHVDRHLHPRYDCHDRALIAELVHDAYAASDTNYATTRAYRNRVIRLTFIAAAVVVAVLVAAGAWSWTLEPIGVVAPNGDKVLWVDTVPATGAVVFLGVALMGAVGGFLSGIGAVATTRGTRNPFSLPYYQMLLKLPVGALSAVVGVLVLQVGFVPGVLPATTMLGLLVWAVAFGAAQQAITRLVDHRVQNLVGNGAPTDEDDDQPAGTGSTQPQKQKPTASARRAQSAAVTAQPNGAGPARSAR